MSASRLRTGALTVQCGLQGLLLRSHYAHGAAADGKRRSRVLTGADGAVGAGATTCRAGHASLMNSERVGNCWFR